MPDAAQPAPLHVGMNLFFATRGGGGVVRYARGLIDGLIAAEPGTSVTAWTTGDAPRELVDGDLGGRVRFVRVPGGASGGSRWAPVQSLRSQWGGIPRAAARAGVDVLHGLSGVVPPLALIPSVATILDLTWREHPESMAPGDAQRMRLATAVAVRRADRIIAISESARRDLVSGLGVDPGRVDVTLLGVDQGPLAGADPAAARARLGLGTQPIVLCVAAKRAHKNLDALVCALPQLADLGAVVVIPGSPTVTEDELRARAQHLGVAERLRLPGWVSDDELEALYAAADCFVLPSLMEGFGLPVLEAMRRGVPVACSDRSALPEVAGGAALLFDPHDHTAIARAVRRLLSDRDLAGDLIRRGHCRCAELTWERTATATLASYRRAISGS